MARKVYSGSVGNKHNSTIKKDNRRKYDSKRKKKK